MPRRFLVPALSVVLALAIGPAAPVAAAPGCDPFQTPPEIDPAVPTAQSVLGFALGSQEVSAAQANQYMAAVDAASDRVITGNAATSVGGRPINYAVVGDPSHVTPSGLAAVQAAVATLRNPLASQADVNAALASAPVILWLSGNVHGNEESGADAALDALYNLAARGDCVVDDILANAVVVILPIQNPDGREEQTRRNLNGFDMNRDWFARTQPETDGKLEVLRKYPPMLYVDAHEFGLSNYFFPPNADPEYHEIPDQAHDWINNLYSTGDQRGVQPRGHQVLPRRAVRLLRDRLRRHGPRDRLPCRRDDVREGGQRPDRDARARALHLDVGIARRRRGRSVAGPLRLARLVGPGLPGGRRRGRSSPTRSSSLITSCSSRSRTRPSAATSSRTTRIASSSSRCSSGGCSGWTSRSAS